MTAKTPDNNYTQQEQEKQFDNYNAYFNMDDRELKRAKREGKMRRKYTKKTRKEKYK